MSLKKCLPIEGIFSLSRVRSEVKLHGIRVLASGKFKGNTLTLPFRKGNRWWEMPLSRACSNVSGLHHAMLHAAVPPEPLGL